MKLTLAQRRLMLKIDAAPFHFFATPTAAQQKRLAKLGDLVRFVVFRGRLGWVVTSKGSRLLGTFSMMEAA